MKKIFITFLFCLPILRGVSFLKAQDSFRIYPSFQIVDTTCRERFRVTIETFGTVTLPVTYLLDSVQTSTTGIFENVIAGFHFIYAKDGGGRVAYSQFNLIIPQYFYADVNFTPNNCGDSIGTIKLSIPLQFSKLVRPLSISFDNRPFSSDTVFTNIQANKIFILKAKTETGCELSTEIFPYKETNDSIRLSSLFIPNNCSSNVGKLSLMIMDSSVAYPLSISFDGRPFSSDTVFNNVAENRLYEIIVKSKQGCDLKARINTDRYKLSAYYTTICANRLGRGSINPQVYGGILPYTYAWNGAGTLNFGDVPIGTYNITATDAAGCSVVNTVTVSTCVWAGDTDTSGVVNQNDLLNIGLAYGEIGLQRPFCLPNSSDSCILWREHIGFDWSKQTPLRVNYKHIDTNGDGIINAADTLAIKRNWSKTRSFAPNEIVVRSGSPNIYVQTTTVRENQWVSLPIILGNSANPADGFYGLAFTINYDPSVVEASTVNFAYNQSWLGSNSELLGISQNDNGHLNIGLTKTNHTNSSGVGQIGTLNFKLKSGVGNRSLNFSVTSIVAINSDAQGLLVNPQNSGIIISGTEEPAWATHISVYPNPTTGEFYIDAKGIDIQQVMVFDIAGKMVESYLKPSKDTPLSILPSGTFFLSILTDKGEVKRKIVKL